jgi:hypothetical protein
MDPPLADRLLPLRPHQTLPSGLLPALRGKASVLLSESQLLQWHLVLL